MTGSTGGARAWPVSDEEAGHVRSLIEDGERLEHTGRLAQAIVAFSLAATTASDAGDTAREAEALRRLGVLHYRRGDHARARELCQQSYELASGGERALAAEALNALAGFALESGAIDDAQARFEQALALGGSSPALRARIEQNLGIVANIRGDHEAALTHYERSVRAFEVAGDERGRALAFHNLGMLSADMRRWDDADRFFRASLGIAELLGDPLIRAHCRMNHTEVLLAYGRPDEAQRSAEAALRFFDERDALAPKSGAHRMLGIVHRETGELELAEARLLTAIQLAVQADSALHEAEASRHLALVYQALDRNQDALRLLNAAHRLFRRLGARVDMVDITAKAAELEGTYLTVVRDWGQSIESADSYTHGHCERVATYAVRVAAALGMADDELTTIRLGAYLHDVGKVRVPQEILNKPGRLTPEEFHIMQQHPVWGLELLAAIEFPWDIKPIIRSHHEKVDGSGYPDRLKGDEIPLAAQIICIADVYDALTTTRSYRPAMTHAEALAEMARTRHWWREDVYGVFVRVMREGE